MNTEKLVMSGEEGGSGWIEILNSPDLVYHRIDPIYLPVQAPQKHKCTYCGSVIYGNRCESCGAPAKEEKP